MAPATRAAADPATQPGEKSSTYGLQDAGRRDGQEGRQVGGFRQAGRQAVAGREGKQIGMQAGPPLGWPSPGLASTHVM